VCATNDSYIMFNHGLYFVMIQRAKAVLNTTLFAQYHKLQKLAWFVEMANYTLFFVYPLPVSRSVPKPN
jgi:hypothetical protein